MRTATLSSSPDSAANGGSARKRNIFDSLQRFMDLDAPKPKGVSASHKSSSGIISLAPDNEHSNTTAESVNAKWEGLQYFEERISDAPDSSYGSLASSASSGSRPNSETAGSKSNLSAKERFLRLKKDGWRRLKNQLFRKRRVYKSGSNVHYGEVSTAPGGGGGGGGDQAVNGLPDPSKLGDGGSSSSVRAAIRSSRSMQNLEQMTRGSYFNLRDATTQWKQRYHSRAELREGRPRSVYQELEGDSDDAEFEDDDDEQIDDLKLRGIR